MDVAVMQRTTSARIPTSAGTFYLYHYANGRDDKEPLALVMGNVQGGKRILVRVHSECMTGGDFGLPVGRTDKEQRMYTLAVKRSFVAQHYLVGGDWGPENNWHSHHYQLELLLEGETLDPHGYLADIVDVERNLEKIVGCYRDKTLNELPDFAGLNPSIEHFTRIVCQAFATRLQQVNTLAAISVKIWENEIAWASYRQVLTQVSPQALQP